MNAEAVCPPRVWTRTHADLDECERLAQAVMHLDGYPSYLAGDSKASSRHPIPSPRDRWPILDVVAHLTAAQRLYETCGWTSAGTVTVPLPNGPTLTELVYHAALPSTGN